MSKFVCLVGNLLRNMSYYAVGKGRFPGVYFSWADCKKQVDHFPGAKYKKFSTEREAKDFISQFTGNSSHFTNGISEDLTTRYPKKNRSESDDITAIICRSAVESICALAVESNKEKNRSETDDITAINHQSAAESISAIAAESYKEENATASDVQKQLIELQEQQEEITKKIQGEIEELKNNFHSLDSRLCKIEAKMMDKPDVDHVSIKSKLDQIHNVEKAFEEEFDLLREKINCLKTGRSEFTVNDDSVQSRRQILKAILSEETKAKALGSRQCGNTLVAGKGASGKRRYSTQSTEEKCVKVPKLDCNYKETPVSVTKLNRHNIVHQSKPFIVNDEGYVEAYTDGACEMNGRRGAKAGIGVWFGDNHPLNISEPVVGRATNNTAEIQAATYAVETAKKAGVTKLLIHTDSNFLINCITSWIKKWKKNGWKVNGGEAVKNKDELIVLDNKLKGIDVKWNHVRGHRGIHGNEMADYLAREGARRYIQIDCEEDF